MTRTPPPPPPPPRVWIVELAELAERDAINKADVRLFFSRCKDGFRHGRIVREPSFARGTCAAYNDFMIMRSLMRSGGLHRVRLFGGRGIDR